MKWMPQSKRVKDIAIAVGVLVITTLVIVVLPVSIFGRQGVGFVAGICFTVVMYFHLSRRAAPTQGSSQDAVLHTKSPRLEPGRLINKSIGAGFDELRLNHCAIMMGPSEDASTYLIPCVGNVNRMLEQLPAETLDVTLESAARLREGGLQIKVLIPEGQERGGAYFPLLNKYTVAVRHFPVPKTFFSSN